MAHFEVKLENGEIRVNLWDYLRELNGEQRAAVIDALACHDEIIDEVANQLIEGFTSAGSRAGIGGASVTEYSGIGLAWRRIAKASGDIAAKEITRLEQALENAQKLTQAGWDKYHEATSRESNWR